MGLGHGGIGKVASPWTLRGLKSTSTWMYDSTTYRNQAKNLRVYIVFAPSKLLPFTFICNDLHSAAILLELHV